MAVSVCLKLLGNVSTLLEPHIFNTDTQYDVKTIHGAKC